MVAKDSNINIEITGMNHEGQGVGRVEGYTVFVDGALTGEIVAAKIKTVKKSYASAVTVEVLKPSGERTLPFCPVYDDCGGCNLQHSTYRETLKFKTQVVRDSLSRIAKIHNAKVFDTIGMAEPFHYRNKAQFPYGMLDGRPISGLYARRSHEIVQFMECAIQESVNDKIRRIVDEFVAEYGIKIYDEITGKGFLRHLLVRTSHKADEVMVVFVVNGRGFSGLDSLVSTLISVVPEVKSVYVNVNREKTNIILGQENILIYGKESILDYQGGFRFNISPMSFYQVNPIQTEILYDQVLKYADLTGTETVFDLYCGIGTISLYLSKKAKQVYGVEIVKDAVEDAKKNVELNGVDNVEFICGDVEIVVPKLYAKDVKADVVVVDPPRKGCDELLLSTIVGMEPRRVVYVSCNPSTLARDLSYLGERGYFAVEVQPVDMFPWTKHVECVVLLTNATSK